MYMYTAANKAAIVGRTTAGINVSIPTHFPPASKPQKIREENCFYPSIMTQVKFVTNQVLLSICTQLAINPVLYSWFDRWTSM
jgi:hypothetical protein